MTVLITGGAGFIGSHTANRLLERGDNVVVYDDFNDRYDPRLKEARIEHLLAKQNPTVVRADIRDQTKLAHTFEKYAIDQVIHLAAWASVLPSIENPHIYTDVNVDGTVTVLEEARKHDVQNIVAASSSSVYGGNKEVPFKETDDVSEPISPYAATKLATETMCATWHNMYDIPTTCLRFFTVYGPWGRPEMALFKFANAITEGKPIEMRGNHTKRDFTYIDDIVNGIVASLDNPNGFSIYNLGNNDAVPLPRFIKAIESSLGKKADIRTVPLPPGDIPETLADVSRAKQELNYNPEISIETGVERFIDWHQSWYAPRFLQNYA